MQEAAEQRLERSESAVATAMARVFRIPLDRVTEHDVVGVKAGSVVEQDTLPQ